MLFSLSNATLTGNDGVVATFDVETPATPGTYTLDFSLDPAQPPVVGSLVDGTATNVLTGTESGEVSLSGEEYTLTITVVGDGEVLVDGDPYTEPVVAPEGSSLNLQAMADPGWQFTPGRETWPAKPPRPTSP